MRKSGSCRHPRPERRGNRRPATSTYPPAMMEAAMDTVAEQKVRSVRAVGTRAVLAELSGTQDVLALQALLLEKPLPGQTDVLAAAETVLVRADSPASAR